MNRTEIINYLVSQRNFKRYLEIGAYNEQYNFSNIVCCHKQYINCAATNFVKSGAEDFFAENQEQFDIVLVDGVHTEEQVVKDVHNALRILAPSGIVIIHDCMPPDEWHQRGPEYFVEGENWNGTVWKAVLRIFNESKHKCILLDTDWGCGIIDTAQSQAPLRLRLPAVLDYSIHYDLLLSYKRSIAAWIRDQVKVFYHLACMGNWQQVFEEQMQQLYTNGFRHAAMILLGTEEDAQHVQSVCSQFNINAHIVFQSPELTYYETPSMLVIEEYARKNEGHVLYLHSKGVSNPADETKVKWRRLMMRELVEKWEDCVLQFFDYDVIGVNWREMPPISHFCGNFWYASSKYLRKLYDFKRYYDSPRYQIGDAFNQKRLGCEFWIGSGNEAPKVLSLYCENVDFCNHEYWYDK